MILYRYINRQLFVTTLVVTVVLTMVLVSGRFIRYLAEAATGKIAADALFGIMFFRLPEFLQLILPLSMYIGVLLVFGRLHVDNEMVVIRAGGIGPGGLLRSLFLPVLMMMLVVGAFSLYATPRGGAEVERMLEAQKQRSALELLSPGRFHASSSDEGQRTTYAESLDREQGELRNIFISDLRRGGDGDQAQMLTVRAETGRIVHREGVRYLQLREGHQYMGRPGQANYRVARFERALIRLDDQRTEEATPEVRGMTTRALLTSSSADALAELQWRLSLIAVVPLMMMLAVPLSKVSPRQGPFMRLVPALLLFMLYMAGLMVMRSQIENYRGEPPWFLNLGWIHLVAGLGVAGVYAWPRLRGRRVG